MSGFDTQLRTDEHIAGLRRSSNAIAAQHDAQAGAAIGQFGRDVGQMFVQRQAMADENAFRRQSMAMQSDQMEMQRQQFQQQLQLRIQELDMDARMRSQQIEVEKQANLEKLLTMRQIHEVKLSELNVKERQLAHDINKWKADQLLEKDSSESLMADRFSQAADRSYGQFVYAPDINPKGLTHVSKLPEQRRKQFEAEYQRRNQRMGELTPDDRERNAVMRRLEQINGELYTSYGTRTSISDERRSALEAEQAYLEELLRSRFALPDQPGTRPQATGDADATDTDERVGARGIAPGSTSPPVADYSQQRPAQPPTYAGGEQPPSVAGQAQPSFGEQSELRPSKGLVSATSALAARMDEDGYMERFNFLRPEEQQRFMWSLGSFVQEAARQNNIPEGDAARMILDRMDNGPTLFKLTVAGMLGVDEEQLRMLAHMYHPNEPDLAAKLVEQAMSQTKLRGGR